MSSYIDISYPLSDKLPSWPGSIGFEAKWHNQMPVSINNTSSIRLDCHYGSHLDAPLHFVNEGKAINEISLEKLIGEAYVVEIRGVNSISASDLEKAKIPRCCKRLLLKTDNQVYWNKGLSSFQKDFTAIDSSAANWIIERGIFLIGIDYLSIQRFHDGPEVHQILLGAEVIIVETLNLELVVEGYYKFICLPINLSGLEGAPVRAILQKKKSYE